MTVFTVNEIPLKRGILINFYHSCNNTAWIPASKKHASRMNWKIKIYAKNLINAFFMNLLF